MGILDFVKSGVQEMMLQRPDDKKGLVVWKHPEGNIRMLSQLTIDADECAVFFKDGKVIGTLRAGRHTLHTSNIPFLSGFVEQFTGGNVLLAEVFFVLLRPIYGVQFGGQLGMMEDPVLGEMATPRVYGEFAFQVTNPEAFIVKYSGVRASGNNDEVLNWIKGQLLNSVRTVVGEVCEVEQKSLLQLLRLQNELAQRFLQRCPGLEEIGCRVVQMGNFHINLDDDDKQRLTEAQAEIGKAKRQARIAGIGISEAEAKAKQRQFELDQTYGQDARYVQQLAGSYQNYAAGQALIGAGKGMAQGGGEGGGGGGPMMAGAGLGVGFGMANMMQGSMGQGGQQAGPQWTPQGAQGPQPPPQGYPQQQYAQPGAPQGVPQAPPGMQFNPYTGQLEPIPPGGQPTQPGYGPAQGAPQAAPPPAAAAGAMGLADYERQLDQLTDRLASGQISEDMYKKLAERIERKIAELRGGG